MPDPYEWDTGIGEPAGETTGIRIVPVRPLRRL